MAAVKAPSKKVRRIRRSERETAYLPVLVKGLQTGKKGFEEETRTTVVSLYGAKITLCARVKANARIQVTNLITRRGTECRVIRVETKPGGRFEVAIEFTEPSPQFWSNVESEPQQGCG